MNLEVNAIELNQTVQEVSGSAAAECEIVLPDYCPNILRILSARAYPSIRAESRRPDRLSLEGNIDFRVMYLAENGTTVHTVTQQSAFTQSFDLKEAGDGEIRCSVCAEQVTARALSPQRMHVRASLRIPLRVTGNTTVCLPAMEEECEYLTRNVCYSQKCCRGEKPLRVADELEISGMPPVAHVLRWDVTFLETEQKPLTEKLIVKADMCFRILYTDAADVLHTAEQTVPVSQILDLTGMDEDTTCAVQFSLLSCTLSPKEDLDGESRLLSYDVEVNVKAEGYRTEQATLITDAYSLKKESECVLRPLPLEQALRIREEGTVRETVEIGYYDSVYDLSVTPVILNTTADPETQQVHTEGMWSCVALIRDTNGDTVSMEKSVPFSLATKLSGALEQVRNECELVLTSMTFSPSDATHLEFRAGYCLSGMMFSVCRQQIVTDVTLGGDKTELPPEMVLYYADPGESVWQIAKKYSCRYEKLRSVNHIETETLAQGEMLTILRG